jgi:hypothetical protein
VDNQLQKKALCFRQDVPLASFHLLPDAIARGSSFSDVLTD